MLKANMLIHGTVDGDEDLKKCLSDQGILIEDWDIMIFISTDNDAMSKFFGHDENGKVVCSDCSLDRLVQDPFGESVWYEDIKIGSETYWVGVKHHA